MAEIRTRPLLTMNLQVGALQAIGPAPGGDRRIGVVTGGTFTGERRTGSSPARTARWRWMCAWC